MKTRPMAVTTIHQTTLIPAAPKAVYAALTDPGEHTVFTGSKATGAPKVGGKFTAWDGYIMGTYKKLTSGKTIVAEWTTTEWPTAMPPSTITITLKEKNGKTELTLDHTDVPKDGADDYATGWEEYYWKPLKKYFKK